MNPFPHQKQREKALKRYYDRVSPKRLLQPESEMPVLCSTCGKHPCQCNKTAASVLAQHAQAYQAIRKYSCQICMDSPGGCPACTIYANVNTVYPYSYMGLDRGPAKPLEQTSSTTPIVGLRVWKVVDDKGLWKLVSVTKDIKWPYRKPLERDTFMAEGIHAVKGGNVLKDTWETYKTATVAGEVYLWGKVIECEVGYLAEFAYPKRLLVPETFDPVTAMMLEDEYGVPVEFRVELNRVMTDEVMYGRGFRVPMKSYPGYLLGSWDSGKMP